MRLTASRENCCFAGSWLRVALVVSTLAVVAYAQRVPASDAGNAAPGTTMSAPATDSTNSGSHGTAASATSGDSTTAAPPSDPAANNPSQSDDTLKNEDGKEPKNSNNALSAAVPDAPSAPQQPASSGSARNSPSAAADEGQQTKRILGIIPNFRAVSVDTHLPPQVPKEKFVGFARDTFDYSSFIWIGALAGVSQLNHSTPEFHQGAAGFGRYYWHSFADQADENLWVEFLLPVAARQDPRYYTLGRRTVKGHNGPFKRAGYAVSRLLVTRTDSGGSAFNISEVGGAGAAAALSNLYYPGPERTWTKTYQRWLLNAALDGMTNVFREFWPDINRAIFHGK